MHSFLQPSVTEKALANQLLSPGTFTPTSNKLHQQTKAQYLREMREELLGTKEDSSTSKFFISINTKVKLKFLRWVQAIYAKNKLLVRYLNLNYFNYVCR